MIKVKTLINKIFEPYAVSINLSGKHAGLSTLYRCVDDSWQMWISKKDALKLAADINNIFGR